MANQFARKKDILRGTTPSWTTTRKRTISPFGFVSTYVLQMSACKAGAINVVFQRISVFFYRFLNNNMLSTLPRGVFTSLKTLRTLYVLWKILQKTCKGVCRWVCLTNVSWLHSGLRQDPSFEAILVIFGRKALNFCLKALEKIWKLNQFCGHAQWWPWRRKCRKRPLASSNLTFNE